MLPCKFQGFATGWIVLLIFALLGDRTAEAIAKYAWNWSRYEDGYGAGRRWLFWVAASCVFYGGFAISAWAVAQLHGASGMAMVLAYLASVLAALVALAAILDWIARPIGVPHTLYYLVSVRGAPADKTYGGRNVSFLLATNCHLYCRMRFASRNMHRAGAGGDDDHFCDGS